MKALLIEETIIITSSAPGKMFISTVVCFEDSFIIILHVPAYTFHVNDHPVASYNFGDLSVQEGVKNIMDSCTSEDELKEKLMALINNNEVCHIKFADYKKIKLKSMLGSKTLKPMNSAMSYVSFNVRKAPAKALADFYPNF
jgi:hypothetical protein